MPKVSVIIPVFNAEQYLRECLDSVVNQTLKDIEIICIDDGSTDGSLDILNEYAQKDNRIMILTQQNQGAGMARNKGLEIAKGEYLSFLDSDDFFELDMLEKMCEKAFTTKSEFVVCNFDVYNTNTKAFGLWPDSKIPEYLYSKETFSYKDITNIFTNISGHVWNKLFLTSFIRNNNIKFQSTLTLNDQYFSALCKILAQRIASIDKVFVHYRTGLKNNIRSKVHKYPFEYVKAVLAIDEFAKKTKIYNDIKNQLYELYLWQIERNNVKIQKHFFLSLYCKHFINKKLIKQLNISNTNISGIINDRIPIVMASDKNYANQMYVATLSMLENRCSSTFYEFFYLVPDKFPFNIKKRFEKLNSKYKNFSIHFINMKNNFADKKMHISHITYPTYYRLKISEILPNYEKIIYLDVDTIILDDLKQLYNTNIEDYYIAGCNAAGYIKNQSRHKERLRLSDMSHYVNAGVLLMNLKKIREDNLIKKFIELAQNDYESQDQDVINIACYGKILLLPLKYNLMTKYEELFYEGQGDRSIYEQIYGKCEIEEAIKNPIIIHYADKIKPWSDINAIYGQCWWKYALKTKLFREPGNSFIQKIFSVKNEDIRKVITILGLKLKFKSKKLIERRRLDYMEASIKQQDEKIKVQNIKIKELDLQIQKLLDKHNKQNNLIKKQQNTINKQTEQINIQNNFINNLRITVDKQKNDIEELSLILTKKVPITKVSVIIPVYNAEQYLRECLNSLINQTLKDIEIICVDDGSTDNSLKILHEYAASDPRVIVLTKENQGAAPARNYGLKYSTGEYIGFVDADDYVSENFYEELYNTASIKNADISATNQIRLINNGNQTIKDCGIDDCDEEIVSNSARAKIIIATGACWNKIYKKAFLKQNNINCINVNCAAEDNYFTDIAVICANKIAVNNNCAYYYVTRRDAQTQKLKTKNDFVVFDIYRSIEKKIFELSIDDNEKFMWQKVINERKKRDFKVFYNAMSPEYKDEFEQEAKRRLLPELIVSLTSYPARIDTVNQTIETLLNQTIKADKVILWLAPEQFPNREKDLPQQLLDLVPQGLIIDWYKDIKSYKKLIPALIKYPDAIIITADDDIIYENDRIAKLYNAYMKNPEYIHCHRAHKILFDEEGMLLPYNNWEQRIKNVRPSYNNFFTGAGSILYPPKCFHKDILNEDLFTKFCPQADDIWLWAMAVLNNRKINVVDNAYIKLTYIEGTQETALWKTNVNENQNDVQLKNVIDYYPDIISKLNKNISENSHSLVQI